VIELVWSFYICEYAIEMWWEVCNCFTNTAKDRSTWI
jgi:hypothetical protein